MLSAICLNLDQSKILSAGNGLTGVCHCVSMNRKCILIATNTHSVSINLKCISFHSTYLHLLTDGWMGQTGMVILVYPTLPHFLAGGIKYINNTLWSIH